MDYRKELVLLERRIHKVLESVEVLAKDVNDISAAVGVIGGGKGYRNYEFIPGFNSVDKMVRQINSDMGLIKEEMSGEERIIIK